MNNLLTVNNLTKIYGSGRGVRNISFELQKGRILGIVGLNGAGKTTLLSCLTGFMEWDSGDISYTWNNHVHNKVTGEVLENLGIVASEYGFPSNFDIKTIAHIMNSVYKNWDNKKFNTIVKTLSLDPNLKIKNYSTGMKTALAIAIALSHHAKILILDEATRGLDIKASAKIRDLLYDHVADGENSIILTSHIMGEIERISDSVLLIDNGEVKFNYDKDDLFYKYRVFQIAKQQLEKIDKNDILNMKQDEFYVRLIAIDSKMFSEKYEVEPKEFPIETIIELFLDGDDMV